MRESEEVERGVQREELRLRKKALRREIRQRAERLPAEYFAEAGAAIADAVLRSTLYEKAGSVMVFASMSREADMMPLIRGILADGKTLLLPRCEGKGVMKAARVRDISELSPGAFGIPEPSAAAAAVPPEQIDLVLAPCVTVDREGRRLGHGGGYYDRFLADGEVLKRTVLVCPEKLISAEIPMEAHDLVFERVVTENGIFCTKKDCRIQ